jgi:hypothetical protein
MKAIVVVFVRASEAVEQFAMPASYSSRDSRPGKADRTDNWINRDEPLFPVWTWFMENPRLSETSLAFESAPAKE